MHKDLYPARADEYGPDVRMRLEFAGGFTVEDYTEATLVREQIRAEFARLFAKADLLLTPIAGVSPEPIGDASQAFRDGVLPFTVPQDVAGLPSCAVPVGFDDLGLPVGVQLTGPRAQRGPRARRRRGAVQRDSIGEGGIRVDPVTCGIRIPIPSSKHQHQSSPGSSERMIGCALEACALACLFGESSQQPT